MIQAYVAEHVDLFGFEPQIKFAAVGKLLKQLRNQFSDDKLIALLRAAKKDTDTWYRRDRHTPTYDLMTLLSTDAINQIRRNHPNIFGEEKEEEHIRICPACGNQVGSGTAVQCTRCGLDYVDFNKPEIVEEHRILAMSAGILPIRTQEDQRLVDEERRKREKTVEEIKNKRREVFRVAS